MRPVIVSIIVGLLLVGGLLAPDAAVAHPDRSTIVAAPDVAPSSVPAAAPAALRVQPRTSEVPWLLAGLTAGLVAASLRRRPRRALAVALALLLGVLAVEHGVHSVHHLHDDQETAACVVAAAGAHLAAALDADAPVLLPPLGAPQATSDHPATGPVALRFGPDPARAPPAPIA